MKRHHLGPIGTILRHVILLAGAVIVFAPFVWMVLTSFKTRADTIALTPRVVPVLAAETEPASLAFPATLEAYGALGTVQAGAQQSFWEHLGHSVVIGLLSTLASVVLGTLAAYGFSRFRIAGAKDWLFFVLSTRFMPPLAVVVPILMLYRRFELEGTHLGLVLLYTVFNLSLSVWLMKGFLDEIPRAYEEAAEICGCAVGTVKSRVSRARRALLATLERGGYARDGQAAGDAMRTILGEADRLSGARD